jgi:predicted amidohydrolase YtcJ
MNHLHPVGGGLRGYGDTEGEEYNEFIDVIAYTHKQGYQVGVHVMSGSDVPVTSLNWKEGIESAVLRISNATNMISGPEERITTEEAIKTGNPLFFKERCQIGSELIQFITLVLGAVLSRMYL